VFSSSAAATFWYSALLRAKKHQREGERESKEAQLLLLAGFYLLIY
jgi:hypothetical protein